MDSTMLAERVPGVGSETAIDTRTKTPQEVWDRLGTAGKVVAAALSIFPHGVPQETISSFIDAHNKNHPGEPPINPSTGLSELHLSGVVQRETPIDSFRKIVSAWEASGKPDIPPHGASMEETQAYQVYTAAQHKVALYGEARARLGAQIRDGTAEPIVNPIPHDHRNGKGSIYDDFNTYRAGRITPRTLQQWEKPVFRLTSDFRAFAAQQPIK